MDRDMGLGQGGDYTELLGAKDGRDRVWRASWTRGHSGAAKGKWGAAKALGEGASAAEALSPPDPGGLLRARWWGCLGTVPACSACLFIPMFAIWGLSDQGA